MSSPRFREQTQSKDAGSVPGAEHYFGLKHKAPFYEAYRDLTRARNYDLLVKGADPLQDESQDPMKLTGDIASARASSNQDEDVEDFDDPFGRNAETKARSMPKANESPKQVGRRLHLPVITCREPGNEESIPMSARSTFLATCVNQELMPRAALVLRKIRLLQGLELWWATIVSRVVCYFRHASSVM